MFMFPIVIQCFRSISNMDICPVEFLKIEFPRIPKKCRNEISGPAREMTNTLEYKNRIHKMFRNTLFKQYV